MLDSYLNRIIEYEIVEQGTRVRDPRTLRTWLSAYAAASSTATSFTKITQAASAPVHQLADPAFAARLLGVDVDVLLGGSPGREFLSRDGIAVIPAALLGV